MEREQSAVPAQLGVIPHHDPRRACRAHYFADIADSKSASDRKPSEIDERRLLDARRWKTWAEASPPATTADLDHRRLRDEASPTEWSAPSMKSISVDEADSHMATTAAQRSAPTESSSSLSSSSASLNSDR